MVFCGCCWIGGCWGWCFFRGWRLGGGLQSSAGLGELGAGGREGGRDGARDPGIDG